MDSTQIRPELNMPYFWGKASQPLPPLPWEQWRDRFHVALLTKSNIDTEELEEYIPRPTLVFTPQDAPDGQRETRDAETARIERNKTAEADAELKLKEDMKLWNELRVGGLDHATDNRKAKSVLFMMLGAEGQSLFQQRHPHASLRELKFSEFWDMVEDLFLKCRNVVVDRVKFFTRRQKPKESFELFHGVLSGLAAKCQLAQLEKELVRDVFISNNHVVELQQKFCKKLIDPDRVLDLAIENERGIEDQKSLSSCSLGLALPTIGSHPPTEPPASKSTPEAVCAVQSNVHCRVGPSRSASSFSSRGQPCRNCGGPFNPGHQTSCPAKSVQCRNCNKKGHFARVCRSAPLLQRTPNNRLNLAARHLLGP